jgi:hypothetical protein
VRSLASQYSALILGNLRFQLRNEREGSDWRYGHNNGKDLIFDYKASPPQKLYRNEITGKIDHGPHYKFPNGKPVMAYELTPLEEGPVDSPLMFIKDIVGTYEAATGSKSEKIAMLPYSEARIPGDYSLKGWSDWWFQTEELKDPRLLAFRDESDMKKMLEESAKSSNFPLICISPNHAATLSNYDRKSNQVEYDNQWGQAEDYTGKNALKPSELLELTAPRSYSGTVPARQRAEEVFELLKPLRTEYENWCTANGVAQDTRYPSKLELAEWRMRKTKLPTLKLLTSD